MPGLVVGGSGHYVGEGWIGSGEEATGDKAVTPSTVNSLSTVTATVTADTAIVPSTVNSVSTVTVVVSVDTAIVPAGIVSVSTVTAVVEKEGAVVVTRRRTLLGVGV